ncbi:MAG: VWA domain-containing protein [Acidobacteria bacterium]|nr:MAG: VWA domain-containing protein [Acidobacteriota bacterium]REK11078.1 MAG: VWA domain-containing protein [Acidobacteriota bacterium]
MRLRPAQSASVSHPRRCSHRFASHGLALTRLVALVAAAFGVLAAGKAAAQDPVPTPEQAREAAAQALGERLDRLPPEQRDWVVRVQGLMTQAELEYFLGLDADYRREAFIEAFWAVRDPDGLTPRNELRERFDEMSRRNPQATTADPRVLTYLLNGPPGRWTLPDGRALSICYSRTSEIEIWFYGGSQRTDRRFPIVFLQRARSQPYEVWRPGMNLRTARRSGLPTRDASLLCADELFRYASSEIGQISRYDELLDQVLAPPRVSSEWLATFRGGTTEVPDGAAQFEARAAISFPARNQSRTVVEVEVPIRRELATLRDFGDRPHHDFRVVGEILRDGELFESFDYRFDGPTPAGEEIPLGFERYLRPGPVELRLLIHDVYGDRYARFEAAFEVPSPEGRAQIDRPSLDRFDSDAPLIELIAPSSGLLSGKQRFSARTAGEIDRVAFLLDGQQIFAKNSPPFSVELDLGELPEPHRVRAIAYRGDEEVATDQLWLNQGSQRLRVQLVEPRAGGIYPGALTARAEVVTPDGTPPAKVEFFLGDERVATLTEAPYTAEIDLPDGGAAVVRAVATLADGASAEEAVVVGGGLSEEIAVEVALVPTVVLGPGGRPVPGIERSRFTLFEDDRPQTISGFSTAHDAPLETLLLIDRSSSMQQAMPTVQAATSELVRQILARPTTGGTGAAAENAGAGDAGGRGDGDSGTAAVDRVALLSFSDRVTVDQALTRDLAALERSIASLRPLGGTALYDAVLTAVREVGGSGSGGAVIVLSDGRDENSRFTLDEVVAAARRQGVLIYTIGLRSGEAAGGVDPVLETLASQSGGRFYELFDAAALGRIYEQIRVELAGHYLLSYTPSPGEGVRQLRVEVDHPDAAAVRSRSVLELSPR